ncbi:hypothetical protein CPB84DRAFT_1781908 [Gymnopilus junonius]|uniref:Uncharacterized protein n=1 Tax=Gymnopilus junonius TaxID=109634 RepID=A0A9P5NL99_GYMJU|nr:hypothetical protein CPB84DRAFT_1781908 [Gymnopilus junonius]
MPIAPSTLTSDFKCLYHQSFLVVKQQYYFTYPSFFCLCWHFDIRHLLLLFSLQPLPVTALYNPVHISHLADSGTSNTDTCAFIMLISLIDKFSYLHPFRSSSCLSSSGLQCYSKIVTTYALGMGTSRSVIALWSNETHFLRTFNGSTRRDTDFLSVQ